MSIQVEKVIHAFIGNGITASFSKRLDYNADFNLDIIWANGESALDYGIEITADNARSLIEALQIVITESESKE
jgi:hypothetical protein